MADGFPLRVLPTLDPSAGHNFITPIKRINELQDVSAFLVSNAYVDIMTFILQLNRAMFPAKFPDGTVQTWPINTDAVEFSAPIRQLQHLLVKLEELLEEVPPNTGPRRFGNISFRRWHELVEARTTELLEECLAPELLQTKSMDPNKVNAMAELKAYFLGSWGSPQRLDYGTGHELSFIAFLAAIWKLNGFPRSTPGVEERALVLGVIQPYLELVRTIIKRYTLEPAGSHGVWGLDDHSFIPYIFGSAQLGPAISETDKTPEEGSLPDAPAPNSVTKATVVERERRSNIYFSAIGFINDVKKGPFWEHSPMLYDISGVPAGWAKINKGMIKMYNAEVLSKFPVVQHFPFGSLFSWDRDPNAVPPATSVHTASVTPSQREPGPPTMEQSPQSGTRAPWAAGTTQAAPPGGAGTAAPWATRRGVSTGPNLSSLPDTSRLPPGPMAPTRAPWAGSSSAGDQPQTTKAPWAK